MYDDLEFGKNEYLTERKSLVRRIKRQEDSIDLLREKLFGSAGVTNYEGGFFAGFNPDKIDYVGYQIALRAKQVDEAHLRLKRLDSEFCSAVNKFTYKERIILFCIYWDQKTFTEAEREVHVAPGYITNSKLLDRFKSIFLVEGGTQS